MQKLCMVDVAGYDRSRLMLILPHKLGTKRNERLLRVTREKLGEFLAW